jgi:HD-GYP domain-containing protein (c-di-GMP phosphodiesterase class II)
MPQIRVKNGPQKGKAFPIKGGKPLVVGRDPSCALQIIDKGVSREHAQIYSVGEMVFIKDLGSRNGSFVNEERVTEELLREGDVIRVGVTQLSFESKRAHDEGRAIQYEEDPNFKTSLELKVDDLYVMEASQTGREGDMFRAMCQATQIVQSERDEKKLFERVLLLIQQYIPADYIYLFLRDDTSGAVTPRAMLPKPSENNVAISRSILRRVISESRAILTADAMQDDRFKGGESIVMHKIRAVLCVPVLGSGQQAMGALYAVNSRMAETFEQVDLQLLTALGTQLALSLENLQSIRQRRRMYIRIMGRIISLMEGLSPKQRGHAERVSIVASAIATELGLSDNQILFASLAGLLHDIGKIPAVSGLSVEASERSSGVAPVLAAIEFLKDIPAVADVLPAIRSHHERFDGSGIPEQLAGDRIPLGARILGAANVFDKLVFPSGSPDKDVEPEPAIVRKAFTEMDSNSGKLFDPEVIRALMVAYRNGALCAITGDVLPASDEADSAIAAASSTSAAEAAVRRTDPAVGTTTPPTGTPPQPGPPPLPTESGETIRAGPAKAKDK